MLNACSCSGKSPVFLVTKSLLKLAWKRMLRMRKRMLRMRKRMLRMRMRMLAMMMIGLMFMTVTRTTVTRMTILASTVTTVSGFTPTVPVCLLAHWIPFPEDVTVGWQTGGTVSSTRTGNLLCDQQPSILARSEAVIT